MITQGTPRGVTGTPIYNSLEPKKENIVIDQLKIAIKKMVKTFFFMGLILAAESIVIWVILNYTGVFAGDPVSLSKVFFLLFIIRLVFRNTILDKQQ